MHRFARATAFALPSVLSIAIFAPSSQAQDVQIEGNLLGLPGVTVGVAATDRLVLLTGVWGVAMEEDQSDLTYQFSAWRVPLEAKLYIDHVEVDTFVPSVILGAEYERQRNTTGSSTGSSETWNGLGVHAMVGLDHFVAEPVGFHVAIGGHYLHKWLQEDPEQTGRRAGIVWRAGFVLRP